MAAWERSLANETPLSPRPQIEEEPESGSTFQIFDKTFFTPIYSDLPRTFVRARWTPS